MRPLLILLVAALAACASGGPKIVKPDIQLVQLYGPTDLADARMAGSVTAHFGFRIQNRASQPITLRRIQIESSGEGGYTLRREERSFSRRIETGETVEETMEALAYFRATPSGRPSNEPVSLRATFHFDSAAGSFRQVLLRNIGQFSQGPR